MATAIGIIGGSGVYDLLENPKTQQIETPFGKVMVSHEIMNGKDVFFMPRHGATHKIPPHQINYRANIFAFHVLGVQAILATNAVGSTRELIRPGDFIIPDQVLDFTKQRVSTFFTGEFEVVVNGEVKKGVVHTDVTEPFDKKLRQFLFSAASQKNVKVHDGGTIAVSEGPRFETPAEVNALRLLGSDILGMTTAPEVFLAKEIEIPYATLGIVTNYGAGMQNQVSHEEVIEIFNQKIQIVREVLLDTINMI